jgi:argininosuccinate lyase
MLMTTNLPSGYHRDLQLLKEHLFPAFRILKNCIDMAGLLLSRVEIQKNILADEKYKYLFSVEEVNKLVARGIPFRDAYRQIGEAIESGRFSYDTNISHSHEGSIGNLGTEEIKKQMEKIVGSFPFESTRSAIKSLLQ